MQPEIATVEIKTRDQEPKAVDVRRALQMSGVSQVIKGRHLKVVVPDLVGATFIGTDAACAAAALWLQSADPRAQETLQWVRLVGALGGLGASGESARFALIRAFVHPTKGLLVAIEIARSPSARAKDQTPISVGKVQLSPVAPQPPAKGA